MTNPPPVNTQGNPNDAKDQNVLSFMIQLVQEKHGDDAEADFINQEANRLYDQFGDNLVSYFEPMLTEQQKKDFDNLVAAGSNQEQLLNFLIQAIPDLEMKIMQILVNFRANYLGIQPAQPGQPGQPGQGGQPGMEQPAGNMAMPPQNPAPQS